MNLKQIYILNFHYTHSQMVFPTGNDIKLLLFENEEILDLLIENKASITNELVDINSKKYKAAVYNRVVEPIK